MLHTEGAMNNKNKKTEDGGNTFLRKVGTLPSDYMKMEALRPTVTWVNFYRTTPRHVTEDSVLHNHRLQQIPYL
jgi:hypothetical protein